LHSVEQDTPQFFWFVRIQRTHPFEGKGSS